MKYFLWYQTPHVNEENGMLMINFWHGKGGGISQFFLFNTKHTVYKLLWKTEPKQAELRYFVSDRLPATSLWATIESRQK